MARLHEARLTEARPDGSVVCTLCPHDYRNPGGSSVCHCPNFGETIECMGMRATEPAA